MINSENLFVDVKENGVMIVAVNRPAKMNALNIETLRELEECFRSAAQDAQVRAIMVTGMGEKAFVAGADISEIAALSSADSREFVERGQAVFRLIEQCHKPVIAAVNGFALGGGCELAMACHLRVGSNKAVFGLPEVSLGIIPGYGGTQRLAQIVGKGKALEIMLTGDFIKAEEAYRISLLNVLVTPEQLMPRCYELIERILSRAPVAVAMVLQAVDTFYTHPAGFASEIDGFVTCCETTDFREGTNAFMEKRQPVFTGV
ncbi:enoyl-CoA hydratase/isomerase family protein [Hymenobacter sp. DG25A]|uniref:enoyl-CoA hydratase/isomerase family protein n=1 Tax=Hymenobacter sp. DG25A TaxID=1385663 RepID=UPI0006BCF659|nr:enoyl-CoA hydratase-related protein [Hymenobacter sp. DG25A]ALD20246.1 enoyl-CoA hydratase [Hymenobacter sp. DG25A]